MATCTYCGCKGHKTPHMRKMDENVAQEHGWRDMICGSYGRAFRGYPWPPQMVENRKEE
jgi:hypothetical protein